MAVEWMESWGHYRDHNDMGGRYRLIGNGASQGTNFEILSSGGPPQFPGSVQFRNPVGGAISFFGKDGDEFSCSLEFDVADNIQYIVGFNMFFEGFESAQLSNTGRDTFIYLRDEAADITQVSLEFLPAGTTTNPLTYGWLAIKRGTSTWLYNGETVANGLGNVLFNTLDYGRWYYIELRVLIDNNDGEIELRVDGEEWVNLNGLDTRAGNLNLDEIWIANGQDNGSGTTGSGLIFKIADFYAVSPISGGNETDFLFPAVVDVLYPNADTAEADFTPEGGGTNVVEIDDNPTHDFDSTNNEANVAADKDRFDTGGSVPLGSLDRVKAVQVVSKVKDTLDTGTRTFRNVIFENATEAVGSTLTLSLTGFQNIFALFEDNPDTSAAWLMADVEAAEIGYEIVT